MKEDWKFVFPGLWEACIFYAFVFLAFWIGLSVYVCYEFTTSIWKNILELSLAFLPLILGLLYMATFYADYTRSQYLLVGSTIWNRLGSKTYRVDTDNPFFVTSYYNQEGSRLGINPVFYYVSEKEFDRTPRNSRKEIRRGNLVLPNTVDVREYLKEVCGTDQIPVYPQMIHSPGRAIHFCNDYSIET